MGRRTVAGDATEGKTPSRQRLRPVKAATLAAAVRVGAPALVVVAIAWVLADTAMFLLAGPADLPVSSLEPGAAAQEEEFPASGIASWELFGSAQARVGNAVAADATEDLATTGLSLVLVGVFAADETQASAALIAQPNRKAKRYRIGDRLPGRATLEAVYRDRVVIRRGGVRELIRFPEPKERFAVASQSGDRAAAVGTSAATAPFEGSSAAAPAPPRAPRPPMPEGDPASILYDAGLTPVKPGAAKGYALGELAANPVLRQAGLRPGDRILSVNGRAVGNVELDQAEFASVVAAGTARIEVQRGGRRWFVTVSM